MPKIYIRITTGIIALMGLSIAFVNCSEGFKVRVPASESVQPDVVQSFPGCIIPGIATQSKLRGISSPFNNQKLIQDGDDITEYVSIVSARCLDNPELKRRSKFTERMEIQNGPQNHDLWVKKIKKSELAKDMSSLSEEIEEDPCVIGLSPNRKYSLNLVRADFDDTFLPQQNHLESLNFFEAVETFYDPILGLKEEADSTRVRVAVIDTGAYYDHPDLAANIYRGPNGVGVDATTLDSGNVVYDGIDIDDNVSHGTHVSGIIAARGANGQGVTGLAPESVQILPINIFYKENPDDVNVVSDSATLIRGLQFAVAENADVINLSLGGGGDDPALLAALQDAVNAGVFIVAAASNEGQEINNAFRTYPAFYAKDIDGMVAVGSTNSDDDSISSFSNYSTEYVEIAAPGAEVADGQDFQGIGSTFQMDEYARLFGTSQSAPMVSAAAALAEALIRENGGSISPAQMETLLLASAEKRTSLNRYFKDGNLLNLQRLAAFVNANYEGTGSLNETLAICQTE